MSRKLANFVASMAQFNAFEEAVDFSFWRELCEKHGTLRHYRRGEYFAHTGEVIKNVGWIVSGGFKHSYNVGSKTKTANKV